MGGPSRPGSATPVTPWSSTSRIPADTIGAMQIIAPPIDAYLHGITPPRDAVAQEMERLAGERRFPIVGPLVGRLLFLLARSIGARDVFECGSGFGYSAIWFAQALPAEGRVTLTDGSAENCRSAREVLSRAGLLGKTRIEQGDAVPILQATSGPFDIIFCDIDKRDYPRVYP